MKNVLAGFGALAGLVLFVALIYVLAFTDMVFERHAAPYREQTRYNTYNNSAAHIEGENSDIADLCRQWRSEKDQDTKLGLADTIRLRAGRFTGELSAANQECLHNVQ